VGLVRSHSDVQGDQNASKRQKTDKDSVYKQTTEQNGMQKTLLHSRSGWIAIQRSSSSSPFVIE
jgi:hypothetical protein